VRVTLLRAGDAAGAPPLVDEAALSVAAGVPVPCERRAAVAADGPLAFVCERGDAAAAEADAAAAAGGEPAGTLLGRYEVGLADAGSAPRPLSLKV
jgi:hypothetical protein